MRSTARHHRCDHELQPSKTRRERQREKETERKTERLRHTNTDRSKQTAVGSESGSHLSRDRSVDCDDGFDSDSGFYESYPLASTNPSTHQQIFKTSEGGVVVVVCVCVSVVGSYRGGGDAHCSLDRDVHRASGDLHHASQ